MISKKKIKTVVTASLDLLFPPSCPSCKKITTGNDRLLCRECYSQLKFIKQPYCSCCGRVFSHSEGNHLCGDCLKPSWAFDKARSPLIYEKIIAGLIHNLKYSADMSGLETFCWLIKQSGVLHDFTTPDCILPVPLHVKRLRKRGFNQALILVRNLFPEEKEKIKYTLLVRNTDTPPQTGLTGIERRNNLHNAFTVTTPKEVSGKNILLVDDVLTTGTTVQECAKALKKAGSKRVEVFTICRAG